MIRIRKTTGDIVELDEDHAFVEICSSDGEVVVALYQTDKSIEQINPGTQASKMYENRFNIKFARLIELGDRYEDDGEKK